MHNSPKNIHTKIYAIGLVVLFLVAFNAISAWTEPTLTPPNGNVSAPINVGNTAQTKAGWLGLLTLGNPSKPLDVNGTINGQGLSILGTGDLTTNYIGGRLNIGTTDITDNPALKLKVNGSIGATAYCDQSGQNCSSGPVTAGCVWEGQSWPVNSEICTSCKAWSGTVCTDYNGVICNNSNQWQTDTTSSGSCELIDTTAGPGGATSMTCAVAKVYNNTNSMVSIPGGCKTPQGCLLQFTSTAFLGTISTRTIHYYQDPITNRWSTDRETAGTQGVTDNQYIYKETVTILGTPVMVTYINDDSNSDNRDPNKFYVGSSNGYNLGLDICTYN